MTKLFGAMRLYFFLIFICFIPAFLFSQSIEDKTQIKFKGSALPDTAKVNRFISLAHKYQNNNPDSTLYYSNKALTNAIQYRYVNGIVDAYLLLGQYTSLNLNDNKKSFYYLNNAQQLLTYKLKSLTAIDSIECKKKLAKTLIGMASCKQADGNYQDALVFLNTGLTLGNSIGDENIISKSLNNLAFAYNGLGDSQRAIEYAFKALKIKEKLHDDNSTASTLSLISGIYGGISDWDNSLKYTLMSLKLLNDSSMSSKYSLSFVNINVATHYAIKKKYAVAESYFKTAFNLINKFKFNSALSDYYNAIGTFYDDQGKDTEAEKCFLLALKFSGNNKIKTADANYSLASIYFEKGKYKESLKYVLSSLEILKNIVSDISREKLYKKLIIKNYEKLNNPAKALEYSTALINNLDSFASLSNIQNLSKIKTVYDFEQKVFFEKEKQRVSQLTFSQEINRRKIIQKSVVGFAILLLVISILITINYKNKAVAKQKMMIALEENHQFITKHLLKEQELASLKNIVTGQEIERNRIAKELHDGIGGSLAAIKLRLTIIFENKMLINKDLGKVINNIDELYQEVRTISHNLIPPQLNNTSFTNVIGNLIAEYQKNAPVTIHIDYLDSKKLNRINQDLQVTLYRIIQELLKNAISHSKCTLIEISLNNYENEITLVFEDNGIGFNKDEKRIGIGLRNIHSRVNAVNGSLVIDSEIGRGSAFHVSIKI